MEVCVNEKCSHFGDMTPRSSPHEYRCLMCGEPHAILGEKELSRMAIMRGGYFVRSLRVEKTYRELR